MRNKFFATKNTLSVFFLTKWLILIYLLICLSQGSRASHREAGPRTGRKGLSQGRSASNREAGPLTGRSGCSEGGQASYKEAGPLTRRLGLSE